MGADALLGQALSEESLHDGGGEGHDRPSQDDASRAAATAISSGVASKYQNVAAGALWPKKADRIGRWRCTSTPLWCHDNRVDTAKVWRRSPSRGGRRPSGVRMGTALSS